MTVNYSKILVCCPASAVTGGPELLHQLVHELRDIGHEAYIVYFPFDEKHECPDEYKCYGVPQSQLIDKPGILIVVPEVFTFIARRFKSANVAIWWLSVDNYFRRQGESKIRDMLANYNGYVRPRKFSERKIPIFRMRKYIHFFQSEYSKEFLEMKGICGVMITDYLGDVYLNGSSKVDMGLKKNIVCYNPKKCFSRTSKLIKAYPEIEFTPIQGLSRDGVYDLLCRSKMYVDFGNHPGKDRLPREAAILRCCVITGRRGAAENNLDIPVLSEFKLNDACDDYVRQFGLLVNEVFLNFEKMDNLMSGYRQEIQKEKSLFKIQVRDYFGVKSGDKV